MKLLPTQRLLVVAHQVTDRCFHFAEALLHSVQHAAHRCAVLRGPYLLSGYEHADDDTLIDREIRWRSATQQSSIRWHEQVFEPFKGAFNDLRVVATVEIVFRRDVAHRL